MGSEMCIRDRLTDDKTKSLLVYYNLEEGPAKTLFANYRPNDLYGVSTLQSDGTTHFTPPKMDYETMKQMLWDEFAESDSEDEKMAEKDFWQVQGGLKNA